MKYIGFVFLAAALSFGQCLQTLPGQAVCARGTPCTTAGVYGTCANLQTLPGQAVKCGCAIPSGEQSIPLDNTWILLNSTGEYVGPFGVGTLWMTTVDGDGPLQLYIDQLGYDNPNNDGSLTLSTAPSLSFPVRTDPIVNGFVNYIWWPVTQAGYPMQVGGTLTFTVKLTATSGTVLSWSDDTGGGNPCGGTAFIRPFISIGGVLPWEAFATGDTGRWFPDNKYVVLSDLAGNALPGTYTVAVPVDPTQWSGVFGQSAVGDPNFASAVASPEDIGLVIGGGCFFGHGIRTVNGSATLSITSFSYAAP